MLLLLLSMRSRITVIHYTSNHPTHAAIRFLYNRLNTYQLHNEEYHHKENIHNILYNNSFPIHPQKPSNFMQIKNKILQHSKIKAPHSHI